MRLTILKFFLFLFLIVFFNACQSSKEGGFQLLPVSYSKLDFNNEITENDTLNILANEFVYNGAGVAIGDLNGDGWDDLFFTGNQVDNELYLNEGEMKFNKVSQTAGVHKAHVQYWSSGVNLVDLNLDGKLDIYVCNTMNKNAKYRGNWFYVNQGNDENGVPIFEEKAAAYGIGDTSHSSHAQFFDYDNDGDLDLYIGVNQILEEVPSDIRDKKLDGSAVTRNLLFQNNWEESLGHPVFKDVSIASGLVHEGYSHSTLINDFNEDGWLDIYVANDFQSDDLIYINQQDGTFKDEARNILKHYSHSSMGSDLSDINHDGKLDFFVTEMQPFYNKRKKLFQGPSNYQREKLTERYGYHYQYTRNTLHLNQGVNPATQLPIFSDVGLLAGVQETDWSWSSLFADFDNDTYPDLFVANGFPKDVTDNDFSDFRDVANRLVDIEQLLAAIPTVKVPNFLFKNKGNLDFENVAAQWSLDQVSYSNGAAYGDLDKDGDLDLVVCNIDDPVFLFENQLKQEENAYLRIKLKGPDQNPQAIGAKVSIFTAGKQQMQYLLAGRGYLSMSESVLHFGLGTFTQADSVIVKWPGGKIQKLGSQSGNQVLEINYDPSVVKDKSLADGLEKNTIFKQVAGAFGLEFLHQEIDYVDFNVQRTLPHKFSQYGPAIAVADINNDGLEDVFLGSGYRMQQNWFIQNTEGQFERQEVNYKIDLEKNMDEDAGILLFDADGDGFKDLYIVKGGSQFRPGVELYQDMFLLNDGKGQFNQIESALPEIKANGSSIKGADFDRDGDIDLFVGSRVLPLSYPKGDYSFILRNDSEKGAPKFTDVTKALIPELGMESMISDALWTDFNNDYWPDLIIMSEWSSIRIFENQQGQLKEITAESGLADYKGWWTSIAGGDFDNDGDIDYIAGNFGDNTFFQCSSEEPLRIYGKDLDGNGSIDPLISCYWPDSLGVRKEYFYHPLQDVIKQFVGIRKQINTFAEYGDATVSDILTEELLKDALVLSANWMKSAYIENSGNGKFKIKTLPRVAQFAPVYGVLPIDLNEDNFLDVLLVGNDHGMEVQQGRADASVGLAMLNDGKGNFAPLTLEESHFIVPGDAKSISLLGSVDEKGLIIASQNNGPLKVFAFKEEEGKRMFKLDDMVVKVITNFADGSQRATEFYWGNTFQSQSGRSYFSKDGTNLSLFDKDGKEIGGDQN